MIEARHLTGFGESAWFAVGNDRKGALVSDRLAEVVGVIGGVGHDHLGGQVLGQRPGLKRYRPASRLLIGRI